LWGAGEGLTLQPFDARALRLRQEVEEARTGQLRRVTAE
jgi:hypothetical protein